HHPNVIHVYRFGEVNGTAYFATEYVPGGNLIEEYVDRPAPPDQAARLVATLADVMHHVHGQGVIHAALKPSNVLLAANGVPKIANCGFAVLLENRQEDDLKRRTYQRLASYLAPEVAVGRLREVTTAADVYGLGAILYYLLTGAPPFRADTVQQTLAQVC